MITDGFPTDSSRGDILSPIDLSIEITDKIFDRKLQMDKYVGNIKYLLLFFKYINFINLVKIISPFTYALVFNFLFPFNIKTYLIAKANYRSYSINMVNGHTLLIFFS